MNASLTSFRTEHLTDDECDDLLIGIHDAASAGHLARCAECQARIAPLEAHLVAFNQATLGWAQARSNRLPVGWTAKPSPSSWQMVPARPLFFAIASLSIVAFGLGLSPALRSRFAQHTQGLNSTSMNSTEQPAERTRQIATDNALLAEIDSALATPIVAGPSLDTATPHHDLPASLPYGNHAPQGSNE